MLRIHFTGADLMRTRIAAAPDPMWELTLSLHQLRSPSSPVFREWRRNTLRRLRPTGLLELLLTLVPQTGYFPDFLTPSESVKGFPAAVDAILSTPKTRLAQDLSLLGATRRLPDWTRQLAAGDPGLLQKLGEALQAYYAAAIEPHLTEIRASVQIDRSRRTRSLADGGYEQLLADMRPTLRWQGSVIEADYPGDKVCHLDGRGLLFVPSFFCWGKPITLRDSNLPPVLVCPVDRDARFMALNNLPAPARKVQEPLAALVGRTRAAVLTTIGDGCTTGEIARRLDVSLATASEHATVLRQAGLVASVRDGNSTVHVLTPLASTLLTGM